MKFKSYEEQMWETNLKKFEEMLRESLKQGNGISWYPYSTWSPNVKVDDLLPVLKKVGYQNANYKKTMKPTKKYCRKIVQCINSDKFYVMKHTNGTICYMGWHDVGGCDKKQLWVRVVGINEIKYMRA